MSAGQKRQQQHGRAATHKTVVGRAPHAQANRPRFVQPKMPAALPSAKPSGHAPVAPPIYRPQPTPKVLQPKSASGAQPAGGPPRRPAAPPVYRPEAKKTVQPKMAAAAQTRQTPKAPPVYRLEPKKIVQPKTGVAAQSRTIQAAHPSSRPSACAHPAHKHSSAKIETKTKPHARGLINSAQPKQARAPLAVQMKTNAGVKGGNATTKGSTNPAAGLRPRRSHAPSGQTVQMLAAYHQWMKDRDKLLEKLEEDHYLLQNYATTVSATVKNKHGNQRNIKALDVSNTDDIHPELKGLLMGLMSSVHIRPETPEHGNEEQNLPTGTKYYEMGMEGGGGTRIVIDANTGDVYFSQHYGGRQNVFANGQPKPDSPFLKITGMTAAEKSVPKYKMIFFRHEENAYTKSAEKEKTGGYAWDVSKTVKLLEDILEGKAEKVRSDFKLAGQNAIDGVLQEMWNIYQVRVSKNQYASIEYLTSCITEVNNLATTKTL